LLFGGILTAVFEQMVFDPTKIVQGISLGPSLFKKWFFERLLLGHVTFLFLFLPVYSYHNRNGKILSFQGEKQNEASLTGSISVNFFVQKSVFGEKNLRTVKKS
jgi:hypothetical protein